MDAQNPISPPSSMDQCAQNAGNTDGQLRSVELFLGCGGLAWGLSNVGFKSIRMSELNAHSVANIEHNKRQGVYPYVDWPIHHEDVRLVDWSAYTGVDLVAGGPPCQPFSIGGRHRGRNDERDLWPEAVRAVRQARPRAFLFENVRGLTRASFSDYLDWVVQSLAHPDVPPASGEAWSDHLARLRNLADLAPDYLVNVTRVNAADFGTAQHRHRVLVIGTRADLGVGPPKLEPTHSRQRLLWDQWVTGTYWHRHGLEQPVDGCTATDASAVASLRRSGIAPETMPWRTVRDALVGLGEPTLHGVPNHVLREGARIYPRHTGSLLDAPGKTLKAGVHGVPGGENMMVKNDGSVRYFTIREAARLQGIPDEFEFVGPWSQSMRQCGNAVPTELAAAVASSMRGILDQHSQRLAGVKRAA